MQGVHIDITYIWYCCYPVADNENTYQKSNILLPLAGKYAVRQTFYQMDKPEENILTWIKLSMITHVSGLLLVQYLYVFYIFCARLSAVITVGAGEWTVLPLLELT